MNSTIKRTRLDKVIVLDVDTLFDKEIITLEVDTLFE
jgi:lipopolysaccharide biosynthesis glycosyltransferase